VGTCGSRTLAEAVVRIGARPAKIARLLERTEGKPGQEASKLVMRRLANFEELGL